jgi:broad-specificity NMP kinase
MQHPSGRPLDGRGASTAAIFARHRGAGKSPEVTRSVPEAILPGMFNVCWACGEYSEAKEIDPTGPFAICPRCGHRHRFRRLPLLVVTGASGAGKTTVCQLLAPRLETAVVLEMDILWGHVPTEPEDDYRSYKSSWLRVAMNVGQAGRPVVLCGTVAPGSLERLTGARYFAAIHYLALVCADDELARRLRARPSWRQSGQEQFVARMIDSNRALRGANTTTLDTTGLAAEESAGQVEEWIAARTGLA